MDDLYAFNMPGVKKRCWILNRLLEVANPKLSAHMAANDIHTTMFVPQWFVTVFLYSLPFPVVLRVFDLFLANGHDVLYYVSLAVFKHQEEKLLAVCAPLYFYFYCVCVYLSYIQLVLGALLTYVGLGKVIRVHSSAAQVRQDGRQASAFPSTR